MLYKSENIHNINYISGWKADFINYNEQIHEF